MSILRTGLCVQGQYGRGWCRTVQDTIGCLTPPKSKRQLQNDYSRFVIEESAPKLGDLHGNTIGIFDVLLSQLREDITQTIVPLLLLLSSLAWIGCTQLHEHFLPWSPVVSGRLQETRGGPDETPPKTHQIHRNPESVDWGIRSRCKNRLPSHTGTKVCLDQSDG